MKIFRKILLVLLVLLVAIQFYRPEKNISAEPNPGNISSVYEVPENVSSILKKSCYDCHSNNTSYPWYNNLQPVASWLHNHIEDGKREVNFDEFATYKIGKQYRKFLEIKEQVEQGEMPLSSYTIIHRNAILNQEEKKALINWAESARGIIRAKYPADSLVMKRDAQRRG